MVKKIFITMGDPRGIGPEIIFKSLSDLSQSSFLKKFIPIIVGDEKILADCGDKYKVRVLPYNEHCGDGKIYIIPVERGTHPGRDSLNYIQEGVSCLKNNPGAALVTAPVSKKIIDSVEKGFRGHTEYIARLTGTPRAVMTFISPRVKMSLLTTHLSLKEVPLKITSRNIIDHVRIVDGYLKTRFKLPAPSIILCSLNPHAGEEGLLGAEEGDVFIPAVKELSRRSINISGPVSAASALKKTIDNEYDFVVSAYHDQLLPAVKTLLGPSVNLTMGLPFIRTSPDHGPAVEIAGNDIADYSSMKASVELAAQLLTDNG